MDNINKYLLILESLKFLKTDGKDDPNRIKANLEIIQKYVKEPHLDLLQQEDSWTYASYLSHILLRVKHLAHFESDSKEDLLSMKQMQCFIHTICEASEHGVRPNLIAEIRSNAVFKTEMGNFEEKDSEARLKIAIQFLTEIFEIKLVSTHTALDTVLLEFMAALISAQDYGGMAKLWLTSAKEKYFKNLLILKSNPKLPKTQQMKLHQILLEKLNQPGGFLLLVKNICSQTGSAADNVPDWNKFEVIANIVTNSVTKPSAVEKMIQQIFDFIKFAITSNDLKHLAPAGVVSLKKFCAKYKELIVKKIDCMFKSMYEPEDILTGTILIDSFETEYLIHFLISCFGSSSVSSLPSELLVPYIPILTSLYSQIPDICSEKSQVKIVIVNILANRNKSELKSIVENLLCNRNNDMFKNIHPRVIVRFNEKMQTLSVQISPEDFPNSNDMITILPEILKTSNNNILIYNCFVCLLHLLDEETQTQESRQRKIDLLLDQDEFDEFITTQFKGRMSIVSCLTDLIAYRKFHSQFHENPNEILDFIKSSLQIRLNNPTTSECSDQNLSLSLAVLQEILENSTDREKFQSLTGVLQKFVKQSSNLAIQHQIKTILALIDGDYVQHKSANFEKSPYQFARSLMEESESHLMVYGITQMIKLLAEKDEETLANKNAILALALHALRDEESYTYLNCVRLFVALIKVLEADVLDVLSGEYLNDDEKIEFRLKVGEAMVKVTDELGPMSYNYKNVLINCFLHGCRHNIDEIRCSSFSNLGTICKLLTYQVHNFFQELISMISSALETEKYLPAKRSAVMVLSQLLWGMDNLIDFQEFLLPILRLLKYIIANDNDPVTRVHASNGMASLNEKCKEFLFPKETRELKISMDINPVANQRSKSSRHILELN